MCNYVGGVSVRLTYSNAGTDLRRAPMKISNRRMKTIFEVTGSSLAIAYALLVASNTGNEILGFALLLISSGLFAL